MDPEAIAAGVMAQPQFAAVSGMVAEANQLINREGPLWNQLNNSIVGSVYEGAAAAQRQQMEELSRAMARGGSARRQGLALAQKFQVQENINRERSTQLWQSKMALEQFRTQAAQQNLSFANAWVDNQSGVRDSFTAALTNLRTFWSQTIPAAAMGAAASAQATGSQAIQAGNDALMAAQGAKWNAIQGGVEALGGAFDTYMASRPDTPSGGGIDTSSQGSLAVGAHSGG
jgi:hypothetical protein